PEFERLRRSYRRREVRRPGSSDRRLGRRQGPLLTLPERLRHEDAAGARRKAWNAAEDAIAVSLVKAGRLEIARVQNGVDAAHPPSLVLRELQETTAESATPQTGRNEAEDDAQ